MIVFVVICNCLITVLNIYILTKVLQWRKNLARVAKTLIIVEKRVHEVLEPAPEFVSRGEKGTNYLHQKIKRLELQLEQLQKLGEVFSLGSRIWRWQFLPKNKKSS
jgi:uncharacterized protein YoxC